MLIFKTILMQLGDHHDILRVNNEGSHTSYNLNSADIYISVSDFPFYMYYVLNLIISQLFSVIKHY